MMAKSNNSSIASNNMTSSGPSGTSQPHGSSQPHDSNTVNDTANSTADSEVDGYVYDTSKLKSPMWAHFKLIRVKGKPMAVCNYCKKPITYSGSTGTKGMNGHHAICNAGKQQKRIDEYQSRLVGKKSRIDESGGSVLATHCFSYDESRKDLAMMIAQHDYSLSMVDHAGFRRFCQGLQPLFKSICRNTVKADINSLYAEEKAKLMEFIGSIQGRVAITTDMWTSNHQRKGYMTFTSHFIDDSWRLQSRLLRFVYVPCPHTAAHILNLIVRSGLDSFKTGIEKVRESVSFWTATPKRMETFEKNAKHLGLSCDKKIALDCKTRWNSTYLMLVTAVKYKQVFSRLKQREPQYKSLPDESDWALANELCERLKIFYNVTELFSGTKYPTTNLFFPKICEIKLGLKKWDTSNFIEISFMAESMIKKFDQYWNESHGVMSMATILDPRFKMQILLYFFTRIYGEDNATNQVQNVKQICNNIFQQYVTRNESQRGNCESVRTQNATPEFETESLDAFFSWTSSNNVSTGKTELEVYLEENTLPNSPDFDILGWWKQNGVKYPILSLIAKDILAIPISTVASESSFSTSGRIVGPHRNKLFPETIETLICTQNWIYGGKKGCVVDGGDDLNVDED